MCGSGDNVSGIIAGLIAAAGILVMAFAEKHGGEHAGANAHHASLVQTVAAVSPVGLDIRGEGAHLDINLRF